jgi:ParB family chromosome partitioning protein
MAPEKTPRRLGRGLDALLGHKTAPASTPASPVVTSETNKQPDAPKDESPLHDIPVAEIRPNHYQPRKEFSESELNDLKESIKASGLLQPITVRKAAGQTGYELVAGERRFRAVKSLGWSTVPAIVRDYDDQTMLTLALIENLQRQDLNPIEEAEGYARLTREFDLTQSEIADLVGKDRSTVANLLRVLHLPDEVRAMLQIGTLTMGHARPLLALEDDAFIIAVAKEVIEHGLSVRAVEQRVREEAPVPTKPKRGRPMKADTRSSEIRHVEDLLRRRLQTDVSVIPKKQQKGEVRIQYYSHDDLNRLLELLDAIEQSDSY